VFADKRKAPHLLGARTDAADELDVLGRVLLAQFKVMAGCAQEAGKSPVCFECPVDDKRMCYAVSGKGGKYLNVNVSSSGTFVEAVIKGCDLVANAQNKGQCHYNIVTRHGTVGTTSVSGIAFECPDDKDCHARSGARLP
jgi:hypothetical protein